MPRVALRQFLRSSFDPGDKTMGSPIIACLGAATLLILASCSFGPITATESPDYSTDNDLNGYTESRRSIRPKKSKPRPVEGYVRVSNFSSDLPIPEGPRKQRKGIGSRSLKDGGKRLAIKLNSMSNDATKDYFTILGDQVLTIIDIAAKEVDKGITNVRNNIDRHRDGALKHHHVPARTSAGEKAGRTAEKYLIHFLKEPWFGIISHIIQESVDRFYIGADIYTNKRTGKKKQWFENRLN